MTAQKPDRPDETIDRLIAAETESALAKFRAGDFNARVQRRIEARTPAPVKRSAFLGIIPKPAWIAAATAVVVLAAAAVLFFSPVKERKPLMASAIEQLILHAPAAENAGIPPVQKPGESSPTLSPMESTIVRALLAGKAGASRQRMPEARVLRIPSLSLEEKVKILLIDKSVERVLALMTS